MRRYGYRSIFISPGWDILPRVAAGSSTVPSRAFCGATRFLMWITNSWASTGPPGGTVVVLEVGLEKESRVSETASNTGGRANAAAISDCETKAGALTSARTTLTSSAITSAGVGPTGLGKEDPTARSADIVGATLPGMTTVTFCWFPGAFAFPCFWSGGQSLW
jgi:hypothetical protein